MLILFKNLTLFSKKSSLRVATFIASSMSSTTRTLRSRTAIKAENETRNDQETEKGPHTSKYFQKKVIKKEAGVLESVKKGVKNARVLRITEVLNDGNLASTSTEDSKTANQQQAVANKVSSKKIKIESKGKAKKTAFKTEQISTEMVKTEVLSDEEFTSMPTKENSTLGFAKDCKNKTSSQKKKKQVKKASIKTEPNSTAIVKTELLGDKESTKISPRKRKQVQKAEKVTKLKTEGMQDIEDIGWQPENWRVVLDNILEMRKWQSAPVDMMGCEECPEKDIPPEVFRYQTLISVMLSSQTRDEVTYAASQRLIAHGLTVDSILKTSDEKIGELIYPAGFWKSKVKYIKNTTQILKDLYNGDIPRTFKDLCKLPGVGPKMANIVMSVGWNETVGIAVDTHVHRISNRLGWVPKPTKEPEQTRKALEAWLPKEQWNPINITMVGFGQTICRPIGPSCHKCLNSELCPFGRSVLTGGLKKSPKK